MIRFCSCLNMAGKPVAVGMVSEAYNSICELVGLATLADYRRQGIATAITREAVARAFEHGTEVVFLTAADERAGRVYQKVGFANYTTVLAYIDNIRLSTVHLNEHIKPMERG